MTGKAGHRTPALSPGRLDLRPIAANVTMYRSFWRQHRFEPTGQASDLLRAPVIGKQQLRDAGPAGRLDARFANLPRTSEKSGGSTGEPVDFAIDRSSQRRRRWRFLKALMSVGYRPGHRLWIVSTHRQSKVNRLARWTYVDLRDSEGSLAAHYLRERPQVLYGPLRALLSMAQELPRPPAHRPKVLVATAELLRPEDQLALRQGFGIEAADFYGMTEIGLFAYRAAGESHYRLVADDVHAEFLPSDSDPDLERLVITTLRSCATPLVRYDTGDLVRRDPRLPHRPIIEFVGREIDGILLPSGKRISPYRITLALESMPDIRRYQVVQQQDASLDVYLDLAAQDESALEKARGLIATVVGSSIEVRGRPFGQRPHQPGEKFRPVRSYAG